MDVFTGVASGAVWGALCVGVFMGVASGAVRGALRVGVFTGVAIGAVWGLCVWGSSLEWPGELCVGSACGGLR